MNDPFVDEEGRLDLSQATPADTGHYRCIGIDIRGATATHVFYVEVETDRK